MPRATWALVTLILVARPAAAQPATAQGPLSLSLEEALHFAEERSPLTRRAARELGVAQAGRVGAGALFPANPAVSVTLGHRSDSSGSTPQSRGFEVTGRLEQTVEIGGQRGRRLAEADRGIDAARIRVDVARVETRARVRAAYVGALLALQNLQNARDEEALGERVFESARARLEAGAGTDVDRNLAEVERGRLTQARVSALLGVGESLDRLRRAAGIAAGRPISLTSTLALPSPMDDALEALLERARQRRLELRALEASARQIDATIVRLRRERVPSPTLFFDVMSQQPGQLYLGGGLGIPIPVWRRNQGELAIASAQRALVDEDRAVFDEQLAIEVEQAQRVAGGLRESVTRWQESAMPAAERNLELVTQGWRAGKFDLFRVVQTSREAADARRRRLELIGNLWDATITLQRAIGEAL